jgi:glycosyltransferase involved in cell wall biosynthesis
VAEGPAAAHLQSRCVPRFVGPRGLNSSEHAALYRNLPFHLRSFAADLAQRWVRQPFYRSQQHRHRDSLYGAAALSQPIAMSLARHVANRELTALSYSVSRSQLLDMSRDQTIFLLNVSGDRDAATQFAERRYPSAPVVELSKASLLEQGPLEQVRELRQLRGEALIFFFANVRDLSERQVKLASGLVHRCRATVFADDEGHMEIHTRGDLILHIPAFLWSAFLDILTVSVSAVALRVPLLRAEPGLSKSKADPEHELDVAYLYPFPLYRPRPGGRLSFLRGSLGGLRSVGATCEIFSGCPLPVDSFDVRLVPNRRRFYLFKESQALSYNVRFALTTKRLLGNRRPRMLYQRHARYVFAGALLARLLGVPLILEYQTSEYWWAKTWGPARFLSLVRLAEEFSIRSATRLAVVSDLLRDELVERGVPREKVIVNPAAVDPERFRPGVGGEKARSELGFSGEDVVTCFAGSFSYFHGIPVLSEAIRLLLGREEDRQLPRVCFLLVGDGPLRAEVEEDLEDHAATGRAVFTGSVSPELVPRLLDAADILLAPTVPMPGGKRFFGSPSKLFEYMAMSKAIVASDLEQLGAVLGHGETAWLVPAGDREALASAIEVLAADPELRRRLGSRARAVAAEKHTGRKNALRLLAAVSGPTRAGMSGGQEEFIPRPSESQSHDVRSIT